MSEDRESGNVQKLNKTFSLYQIILIGATSTIGTGVLFSTAGMTALAGPGAIIAWGIASAMFLCMALPQAELTYTYPEAGGPTRFSIYSHGKVTNLFNGMSDLTGYIFIIATEAFAVVEGVNYLWPIFIAPNGIPSETGAVLGLLLLLAFVPLNYFGARLLGHTMTTFGSFKQGIYVLLGIGILLLAFHPSNFSSFRGFLPFGGYPILLAIPLAMFAMGGTRVVSDFSEEVKDKNILPKVIILTTLIEISVYILFSVAFVSGINWAKLGIVPGNWAALSSISGNPFVLLASDTNVLWILVVALIAAILGPFITGILYLGGGTRMLFSMGRSGTVSNSMTKINGKYKIPSWALLALAVIAGILVFITAPIPSIYGVITDAVIGYYIGYLPQMAALSVTRKQGISQYKMRGNTIFAALGFTFVGLIVYWSGWPSVPYSEIIIIIGVIIFASYYRITDRFKNAIWLMIFFPFSVIMAYIGSNGALNIIPFWLSTIIVAVVMLGIFYPWAYYSGLEKPSSQSFSEVE